MHTIKKLERFFLSLTLMLVVFVVSCSSLSSIDLELNPTIWPQINSAVQTDEAIEKRVQEILSKMSLEEKVAQMTQAEIKHVTPEQVKKYHLGSILNGGGSFPGENKYAKISDWVNLADRLYLASMDTTHHKNAIPIIWGTDAVHGHNNVIGATIFPHNIGLGAANNPNLIKEIGKATALEVLATGIDWIFAPTVAVVQNDRWGRTYESYSENPMIVKDYAKMVVEGIQGDKNTAFNENHVVSTVKHFVGDGGTKDGVDQGNNTALEQDLFDIHAQGYVSGLTAGSQTVMASFNSWHGQKIHGNKYLLTDVLKKRMGFDGFVIGDWNGHGQVKGCSNDSCPQAINAGVDMIMVPEDWEQFIWNTIGQVKSGEISMARIDDAVTRILRVKLRAGLFTAGKPSSRKHAGNTKLIGHKDHRKIARQAVRESLVLLKNKNNILPLTPKSHILVAGSAADDIGQQSGGWTISWQGTGNSNSDFPNGTSIYSGIEKTVKAAKGSVELSKDGNYQKKPDVAIVVFGETPYAEGQGDIGDLFYGRDNKDLNLLKKLKSENIPVITVFITGRPMWVNPHINQSDAFVVAWLPGSEGIGVADVIIGDVFGNSRHDFKGKLSFSWPISAKQTEVNIGQINYNPVFSYGHGLTYNDNDVLSDNLPEVAFPGGNNQAPQNELAIFAAIEKAPFAAYVGDKSNWSLKLNSGRGATASGSVSVKAIDRRTQEDSRHVKFNSKDIAQYFFQSITPMNLQTFASNKGQLKVEVKLMKKPSKNVFLAMGCTKDNCQNKIDITQTINNLKVGEWSEVAFDLACFNQLGVNFKKLMAPFNLQTMGQFELGISKIELKKQKKGQKSLNCVY